MAAIALVALIGGSVVELVVAVPGAEVDEEGVIDATVHVSVTAVAVESVAVESVVVEPAVVEPAAVESVADEYVVVEPAVVVVIEIVLEGGVVLVLVRMHAQFRVAVLVAVTGLVVALTVESVPAESEVVAAHADTLEMETRHYSLDIVELEAMYLKVVWAELGELKKKLIPFV